MRVFIQLGVTALALLMAVAQTQAQRKPVLRGVKTIQVTPTIVANPEKVKEEFGPNLVEDALRNALRLSNVEVADDASIKAHIVLDEFSSGSTAKRLVVGFGAGRSTVAGRLVFQDEKGTEIANTAVKVRGNLMWSAYQGGSTQRRQATNAFDQRLLEEIARLK